MASIIISGIYSNKMGRLSKERRKNTLWIAFVLLSIVFALLFFFFPNIGEKLYGQTIYPKIRKILDIIYGPFDKSLALILIGVFLFKLVDAIVKKGILAGFKFLFLLFLLFYWLWGFNYFRVPVKDKMDLHIGQVADSTRLKLTHKILDKCITLSQELTNENSIDYDNSLLLSCYTLADSLPFLTKSKLASVPIFPPSIFLRIGILGMYFPYTGQAQYEIELGPIDRANTMAHEWCHAAGIAPEHEANFLAYLICTSNEYPVVRYSAYMNLLNELLFHYRMTDKTLFDTFVSSFTSRMKQDFKERREMFIKYRGPISELSDEMIDKYLKLNQQGGIGDYNRLSDYVFALDAVQ